MDQAELVPSGERPLWRRVWDYPLVAMVVAAVLVVFAMVTTRARFIANADAG